MQADGMVAIAARALQEALAKTVPFRMRRQLKKRPGQPVSITFDSDRSLLTVTEAAYGLYTHSVPATGHWPGKVQVAGEVLRRLADKYARDDRLSLVVTRDELSLLKNGSRISLKRIDEKGTAGIEEAPIPPNRKHKGAVVVPPDPVEKRLEWNDMWDFSARMPIPQHRKPTE